MNAKKRLPFVTTFSLRKYVVGAILFALLMTLEPGELPGQRRKSRKERPKIGDIILFELPKEFPGERYGLIVNTDSRFRRLSLEIEVFDDDGEVDSMVAQFDQGFVWELIDRFEMKSELTARKWRSLDGKFEIKAKMLQVEDDKVRLEQEGGKQIAVKIRSLSQRDRDYIKKNKDVVGTGSNPFAVEASAALPAEVLDLMDRRNALLARNERHQRLAKLYKNFAIGDIIEFESFGFNRKKQYGIVTKTGFFMRVEAIDDDGELDDAHFSPRMSKWAFYDREFVAIPMQPRKWSSASGKFTLTATLAEATDEEVVLEKEDGDELTIKLSKLSEIDQKHVRRVRSQLNIANDPQLAAERPDYDEDLQVLLERREEVLEQVALNYKIAREAAKMKGVRLRTGPFKLRTTEAPGLRDEAFVLKFPLRVPQFARIKKVCYAKEGGVVALVASHFAWGKPTLAVVDVETSEVVINEEHEVGPDAEILAISPSGKTILVGIKVVFDRAVELWRHEDGRLKKLGTFDHHSFWAPHAHLFDDQSGVIQSSYGNMTFFDITDRVKPTHAMSIGSFGGSRGFQIAGEEQQALFVLNEDASKLYAVDGQTRMCLGGINFKRRENSSSFNFAQVNADGKSAVYVESDQLSIYSLETGKLVSKSDYKGNVTPFKKQIDRFQYLGNNLVLNQHGKLFDLSLGLEIGKVDGRYEFDAQYYPDGTRIIADVAFGRGADTFGTVIRGSRRGGSKADGVKAVNAMRDDSDYQVKPIEIRIEKLPMDEIRDFANLIGEDDIVEFGNGDSVEVIVDIEGDRSIAEELEDYADDVLAGADIRVERNADFTLELSYTVGARQEKTFRIIGWGPATTRTESIIPKTCKVELKYLGETIWTRTKSANLNNVGTEEGLNRIIKLSKEMNAEYLFDIDLPTEVRVMIPSRRGKFSWE